MILQPNVRLLPGAYWDFFDHHTPLTERCLVEALTLLDMDIQRVVARFLPYTTKSALPQSPALVRLYLRLPWPGGCWASSPSCLQPSLEPAMTSVSTTPAKAPAKGGSAFVRYLVAGGVAAAANFGSRFVFSLWWPFEVAVTAAFLVGLVSGFFLMRGYAFRAQAVPSRRRPSSTRWSTPRRCCRPSSSAACWRAGCCPAGGWQRMPRRWHTAWVWPCRGDQLFRPSPGDLPRPAG